MNVRISLKLNFGCIIALIFALSPFLQLYTVPGIGTNMEFSLVFSLGGLYAIYYFLKKPKNKSIALVVPIMTCMFMYCNFNLLLIPDRHIYNLWGTSFIGIFFNFLILAICVIDFKNENTRHKYFEYVVKISVFMSVVVAFQALIYYTTGSTITPDRTFLLPFKAFFTNGAKLTQETGLWVFGPLYRPSAFFLEPAHFSQYCSIGLAYSLWKSKKLLNWASIAITIGIIITTSGLGLLCIILMWGTKLFINGDSLTRKRISRLVGVSLLITVISGGLFVFSDSFQRSVLRIINASDGFNSAIMGRLWSVAYLENFTETELLFGMGYKNIPTYYINGTLAYVYMTGIVQLFYCEGILGGSIFIICYFLMLLKSYKRKAFLPLYILILYLPFLICSDNLGFLTLIEFIPFLYINE